MAMAAVIKLHFYVRIFSYLRDDIQKYAIKLHVLVHSVLQYKYHKYCSRSASRIVPWLLWHKDILDRFLLYEFY